MRDRFIFVKPTFEEYAPTDATDIWNSASGYDISAAKDMLDASIYAFGNATITKIQQLKKEFTIAKYTPKSIEYSADHTTVVVIWSDGDKTIVRRSDNDPDDIYMAFTAALAKKIFGSNSAVKRVIQDKTNEHQPKKKKNNSTFDAVSDAFQTLAKAANRFPMPGEKEDKL